MTPDYCEPLVGVRVWRHQPDGLLHQLARWPNCDLPWLPGVNGKALCIAQGHCLGVMNMQHAQAEVPVFDSRCGFWAYKPAAWPGHGCVEVIHQLDEVFRHTHHAESLIMGEVLLWGTVIEHQLGYRASRAYPKSLNNHDVAQKYGVPYQPQPTWEALYEHWLTTTNGDRGTTGVTEPSAAASPSFARSVVPWWRAPIPRVGSNGQVK